MMLCRDIKPHNSAFPHIGALAGAQAAERAGGSSTSPDIIESSEYSPCTTKALKNTCCFKPHVFMARVEVLVSEGLLGEENLGPAVGCGSGVRRRGAARGV